MIMRRASFSVGDVERRVAGRLIGQTDVYVYGVCTDTRDPLEGLLFVALRGEHFDAHDFLERAIEFGAAALLVQTGLAPDRLARLAARVPVVEVPDTLRGLGALAAAHRARFRVPVIALTGSNGKTTTKQLLYALLSATRKVLATEGNLNNLIGLPMTLLGLEDEHRAAVVEMGMNAPGEIARMTEIARPDAALITNVGPAHIGMLGSIEAVAKAKGEIFSGLDPERGYMVVNLDDERVVAEAERSPARHRRTFGWHEAADVRVVSSETQAGGEAIVLSVDGQLLAARIPVLGPHNAVNAAAAVAAATLPCFGAWSPGVLEHALEHAEIAHGRLEVRSVGAFTVIDDSYNANAASTIAAIETVARRAASEGGRFVVVLGEMRELGSFSGEEHARVGLVAVRRGAALVAALGPEAAPIAREALAAGLEARHEAEDLEQLYLWTRARLQPGDTILVKGSRGMRMERFIERLESEAH
jgi:UDP-N-acetylmuramoyl-tripeptide--D-alanyl-D-alanine ligase